MSTLAQPMFLSTLDVTPKTNGVDDRQWVLTKPLMYHSAVADRDIVVPAGFDTDFASVPRVPFVYDAVGGFANEASVVHDYLYTFQPVSRRVADAVFREAMAVTGVAAWRRWVMWAGVRLGGWSYWNRHH